MFYTEVKCNRVHCYYQYCYYQYSADSTANRVDELGPTLRRLSCLTMAAISALFRISPNLCKSFTAVPFQFVRIPKFPSRVLAVLRAGGLSISHDHASVFFFFWGCTFSHISPPVKIRGGVGGISDSTLHDQPRMQPLIYYWCGAVARTWRLNTFSMPIFREQFLSPKFLELVGAT